jgi:hypothetical protein
MRARRDPTRRSERGVALILALALVAILLVVGVAIIRVAGNDRIDAAKVGVQARAQLCAEAGLQYGRRFYGSTYETRHNWNDYLADDSGYRYDPSLGDPHPTFAEIQASAAPQTLGKSDGSKFDDGADIDGDGQPDFWVSVRDDDDETPLGAAEEDRRRDNNETVILRSECINPALQWEVGGQLQHAVVEAVFTHVQGQSGYGNAQITSNSPDVVGMGGNSN